MTSAPLATTRAEPAAGIGSSIATVLRGGWVLLALGALIIGVLGTPELHRIYTVTCPELICDKIAEPNAGTVRHLADAGVSLDLYAGVIVALDWLFFIVWLVLGGIIVWKRPTDAVAMSLAYSGVIIGAAYFVDATSRTYTQFELPSRISAIVMAATLPLFLGLFPSGRWVPDWARWIGLIAMSSAVVTELLTTAGAEPAFLEVPFSIGIVGLLGCQVYRYRRVSEPLQRQQTKWFLFGASLYITNFFFAFVLFVTNLIEDYQLALMPICYGGSTGMVIAIGFAVLRYRLFDIDVILNRALVYGGLTLSIILIYAAVVGGIGALLHGRAPLALSVVAGAIVAILFQPLRLRLQRGANRLVYGARNEPYELIDRLGRRLEESLSAETVLPTIVETVATALKLPYAGIALGEQGQGGIAAEFGLRGDRELIAVPLVYQGEAVGELRLAARIGERNLSASDRRLLEDLARPAGIAVQGVAVTRDLQRAREQLVSAREEERRRLRRDLHDGIGPTLASQALTLDTAGLLLESDYERAALLLKEAKTQSQLAVAEIRRVVYDLRPPALDDLGLGGALREVAHRYAAAGLAVSVDIPDALPLLPAAVEVAALRIAQEAMANTARHAAASQCSLGVIVDDTLRVTVSDNGTGIPDNPRPGVGLHSMRERAEELGGHFEVGPNPEGGTTVSASLPLDLQDGRRE